MGESKVGHGLPVDIFGIGRVSLGVSLAGIVQVPYKMKFLEHQHQEGSADSNRSCTADSWQSGASSSSPSCVECGCILATAPSVIPGYCLGCFNKNVEHVLVESSI